MGENRTRAEQVRVEGWHLLDEANKTPDPQQRRQLHARALELARQAEGLESKEEPKDASRVSGITRSRLILRIATIYPHLRRREAERIVDRVFAEMAGALALGRRVKLRGFGTLWLKHRRAHIGHNPRTGAAAEVSRKVIPAFRTSKALRERLNRE